MHVPPTGKGRGTPAADRLLSNKGSIGVYVSQVRKNLLPGRVDHFNWIRITTSAFSELFQASSAIIIHSERYNYYVNEADFSHGRFMPKAYLGTKDMGWDRFDALFPAELEGEQTIMLANKTSSQPACGICVPNLNLDLVRVFNREGRVTTYTLDEEQVERLVFDRDLQLKGSIMVAPIIARSADEARRAMVYLYSPKVDHFELPLAGYAAHLLAGAAAPALKFHFNQA